MARRIFTRNPKDSEGEATQYESDEGSQPSPNDPPLGHALDADKEPGQAIVPGGPGIAPQDRREPGWYPDATDSGLMRYWDGFHFTGQAKRVSSAPASTDGAEAKVQAAGPPTTDTRSIDWAKPETTDLDVPIGPHIAPLFADLPVISAPNQNLGVPSAISTGPPPAPNHPLGAGDAPAGPGLSYSVGSDGNGEKRTAMSDARPTPAEPDEGEEIKTRAVVANDESVRSRGDDGGNENPPNSSGGPGATEDAKDWGKDAERAVTRALTVDTPEAWQEAANVAVVVSEMAQTMQAVADANQTARHTAKAAEEAAEKAGIAAQTAADAKDSAERMAKAAQDAAEAARLAAQKAVEAKEEADRTARTAPQVAETAEGASRTAADAKHKAQALEQVVARARSENTPAAWSEALRLAVLAVDTKRTAGSVLTELDSMPPPVIWKLRTPLVESDTESLDQALGVQEQPFGLRQAPQ